MSINKCKGQYKLIFLTQSPNSYPSFNKLVLPRWLTDEESACNAGDMGSIPGLGRSSGEGNGNPLEYSGLESPMDKRAWQSTGLQKNQM